MTLREISSLTRLNCSVYGNPRYRVHFTDGSSAITSSDASFCYGINNRDMRDNVVRVEFTRAGRIANMTPLSAEESASVRSHPSYSGS